MFEPVSHPRAGSPGDAAAAWGETVGRLRAMLERRGLTSARLVWIGTLVSMSSYLLSNRFGMPAMAITLAVWLAYGMSAPARSLGWLLTAPAIWAFPLWAMASMLWSDQPDISLRQGIELVLFTGISLLIGRAQTARSFVSAMLCALLLCVALSLVFGERARIGLTDEVAFIGLFSSKNNFAFVTCLMMLASLSVLTDVGQHRRMRMLGGLGLLAAPAILIKTISLGALVSGFVGCSALGAVLVYRLVAPRWRGAFLAMVALFGLAVIIYAGYAWSQGIDTDTLLESMGKDPSLTGRTFLWARARSFIADRPLFGLGYQSFWVQGNVEAEGLWRFADIESRAGFHFHNLFFATAVELGYVGVSLLALQVLTTFGTIVLWVVRTPAPINAFFFSLFVFFMIRMSVELDFLGPFSYGALIVPLAWVCATRRET